LDSLPEFLTVIRLENGNANNSDYFTIFILFLVKTHPAAHGARYAIMKGIEFGRNMLVRENKM
jgi:hypothetical protein